ncbi:hypothetical protein D9M73_257560 [compost metagenome]
MPIHQTASGLTADLPSLAAVTCPSQPLTLCSRPFSFMVFIRVSACTASGEFRSISPAALKVPLPCCWSSMEKIPPPDRSVEISVWPVFFLMVSPAVTSSSQLLIEDGSMPTSAK